MRGAVLGSVTAGVANHIGYVTLLIIVSVITLLEEEASSQESPAYEENAPPKNPSLKFPPHLQLLGSFRQ
jgi:hypothetical protein